MKNGIRPTSRWMRKRFDKVTEEERWTRERNLLWLDDLVVCVLVTNNLPPASELNLDALREDICFETTVAMWTNVGFFNLCFSRARDGFSIFRFSLSLSCLLALSSLWRKQNYKGVELTTGLVSNDTKTAFLRDSLFCLKAKTRSWSGQREARKLSRRASALTQNRRWGCNLLINTHLLPFRAHTQHWGPPEVGASEWFLH